MTLASFSIPRVVFLQHAPEVRRGSVRGADSGRGRRHRPGGADRDLDRAEVRRRLGCRPGRESPAAPTDEPDRDEYLFEGYELEDALEAANGVLEDDVRVLEQDGRDSDAKPFVRKELLGPLERGSSGGLLVGLFSAS